MSFLHASSRFIPLSWRALGICLVLGLLAGLASLRPPMETPLQSMTLGEAPAAIAAPSPIPFTPPSPHHYPRLTQARLTHAYLIATPQP